MFNRNNSGDYVTREEATQHLSGYIRKADAETHLSDVQTQLSDLRRRVAALEILAAQRRVDARAANTRVDASPASAVQPATPTGVDYGAVAFGLSEIRRRVAEINGVHGLGDEYAGAVQFFADVFKVDPSFNEATFKRLAGVADNGGSGVAGYERPHP